MTAAVLAGVVVRVGHTRQVYDASRATSMRNCGLASAIPTGVTWHASAITDGIAASHASKIADYVFVTTASGLWRYR